MILVYAEKLDVQPEFVIKYSDGDVKLHSVYDIGIVSTVGEYLVYILRDKLTSEQHLYRIHKEEFKRCFMPLDLYRNKQIDKLLI